MTGSMRCNGLRTLALTLTLGGLLAARAGASPITATPIYYNTSGSIGDSFGPIVFSGIDPWSTASFISPGSFPVGTFNVTPLPTSASLTYNNTPFTIDANFSNAPIDPSASDPSQGTVHVQGTLDGTITGNTTTNMFANVTSVTSPDAGKLPFPLSALSLNLPQAIAPNGISYGATTLTAQLNVAGAPLPPAIPEPTSIALFLTALGGVGIRQRLLRNKLAD